MTVTSDLIGIINQIIQTCTVGELKDLTNHRTYRVNPNTYYINFLSKV